MVGGEVLDELDGKELIGALLNHLDHLTEGPCAEEVLHYKSTIETFVSIRRHWNIKNEEAKKEKNGATEK